MPFHLLTAILPAASTCLTGSLALYAWQRHEVNGARPFAWFMGSVSIWCFFNVFEQISPSALQQIIFGKMEYFGIAPLPVFWLLFTLRYAQRDGWLSPSLLGGLSTIPLMSLLLSLTDCWHGWIWKTVEFQTDPFPRIIITHGWWFNYVMIPYCYTLMIIGFGVLLSASFSGSKLYRTQTLILLCSSVVPFACNVLYVIAKVEFYGLDVTPIGFVTTGLFIHFGLFRARFLDIAPVSYRTVFLNTADAVILLDIYYRIVDLNLSAMVESAWQSDMAAVIGQPFNRVFSDYWTLMNQLGQDQIELTETIQVNRLSASEGSALVSKVFRQVKVRSLSSPSGKQIGWVIIIRDVTLEKQQQEQLEQFAYVDSLTGLFNRRQLELKAEEIFLPASVHRTSIALLYVDLNRFKPINDNYGHAVGDVVLQHFAHCLRSSVRQGDMVVRLGGDEFVAMLYEADVVATLEVQSRLLKMLNQAVVLAGHQFRLSASIGIAYYPTDGSTLSDLLRRADQNMYREKRLR